MHLLSAGLIFIVNCNKSSLDCQFPLNPVVFFIVTLICYSCSAWAFLRCEAVHFRYHGNEACSDTEAQKVALIESVYRKGTFVLLYDAGRLPF